MTSGTLELGHASGRRVTLDLGLLAAAYYYAVHHGDLEKARAWAEVAEEAPDKRRAHAAIALLEGDRQTAVALIDEALAELHTGAGTRFDTGGGRAERDGLLRLRERAVGDAGKVQETKLKKSDGGCEGGSTRSELSSVDASAASGI